MFSQLKNIDTAFRHIRLFSFFFLLACLSLSTWAIWKSYELSASAGDRVYILAGSKAMEAFRADRKDNIPVEARDHIETFHTWFFSLDPDDQVIREHIAKALDLADESAKRAYDNLREQGFYSGLIAANISQEIMVDSIRLDMDLYPYPFTCYARQKLIRASSTLNRKLVTRGRLRSVSRSDHNPHGFLIQNWETIENSDLPTKP